MGTLGGGGDALPSCRGHLFIIVRLLFDRFLPLLYFGYMFISGIYLCFILFYVSTQCFISVGRVSVVCFPEDVQPCMLMGMPCSSFFRILFFSNPSPLVFESWTERVDSEITVFAMSLLDFNMRSLEFSSVKFVLVMTSCAFRVQYQ